ncbi:MULTISPECIES: hypothetical protein [unclassified Paenibacillus]|uniref:hypothetical protein n=1 Tax=unclassified Paenibacillus TaxID=185978 RepID=UPI001AE1DB5F|nr:MULTISPECIES: hypothetical protein [unclassified Paenibacillus]MBP1153283.1 hypothetical protein [Paenibacillus sp. PvP091]MBP1171334.1 hypothetical protein [Paenibacillus sp. PvR098]MBP2442362.1 hypothetical protein [Paenibacillus sp. PvP052]
MENIIAAFPNRSDMEHAAEALRKQGVINLKLEPAAPAPVSDLPVMTLNEVRSASMEACGKLQVLVESSRRRQAMDTISRYGGECSF